MGESNRIHSHLHTSSFDEPERGRGRADQRGECENKAETKSEGQETSGAAALPHNEKRNKEEQRRQKRKERK